MRKKTEETERGHKADSPVVSRRFLLGHIGAVGVVTTRAPAQGSPGTPIRPTSNTSEPARNSGYVPVQLRVNRSLHNIQVDARTTLLDCLRESLLLTGTKKGCDHGQCGACTVHVNGRRINSCLTLAVMHDGDEVTTIEGVGQPDNLHPMQASFVEHDGFQCGYCTSGQIMSAVALVREPCGPEDNDVKELMSGNICRCGAYRNIISAIQATRRRPSE